VTAARLILVSDTHLSASAPQAQANWDAVVSEGCVQQLASCSSWTDRDRTRPFLFLHGGVGTMVGFADLLAGVSPLEPF